MIRTSAMINSCGVASTSAQRAPIVQNSRITSNVSKTFAVQPAGRVHHAPRRLSVIASAEESATKIRTPPPAITLTDNALDHLKKLKAENESSDQLVLRMGVRSGGCSGMSYFMDFESNDTIKPDDAIMEYEDFKLVCDPKSLLYLFGMQLDWSSALIGGGFQFNNPNASDSCGCGKSFGV